MKIQNSSMWNTSFKIGFVLILLFAQVLNLNWKRQLTDKISNFGYSPVISHVKLIYTLSPCIILEFLNQGKWHAVDGRDDTTLSGL